MNDGGKLLRFRERSRVPYDVLYLFPTTQLPATGPALAILDGYGVQDPQALIGPCVRGRLQDCFDPDVPPTHYAKLHVPAAHATAELTHALRRHVRDLHVYGLERLIAKAAYLIQLDETVGGGHIQFHGLAHEARSVYNRWCEDGPVRTLTHHLEISPALAVTVLEREADKPVYALYGLQTADDEFLIEASDIHGPYRCALRGERIVVTPADE